MIHKAMLFMLGLALGALAGMAVMALGAWAVTRPSLRVVQTWVQPADAPAYDAFGPYQLSVVEADLDWSGFPFRVERRHFIYVGLGLEATGYGHRLDYGFHPLGTSLARHVAQSQVTWTAQGVTFTEASGHQVFIPARLFVGPR